MIYCEQCQAPIDLRRHDTCWNCNAGTQAHPKRSDIRYWIAYSKVTSIGLGLCVLATAGLLAWQVIGVALGETSASDFFDSVIPLAVLLIVGCRLIL